MAIPTEFVDRDTAPWFDVSQGARKLRLTAGGNWTVLHAATLDPLLLAIDASGMSEAEIDGSKIAKLDSTGCWLLVRTKLCLEAAGLRVTLFEVPALYAPLLASIEAEHVTAPVVIPQDHSFEAFLERTGRSTFDVMHQGYGILGYIGRVTVEFLETAYKPRGKLRVAALVHQIEEMGINALPIVGLLMFLIGIVLAYQGADQLKRFGMEIFTINASRYGRFARDRRVDHRHHRGRTFRLGLHRPNRHHARQ